MKIRIMCSALLLSTILITECKKDENKVVVSGITETDATGNSLGTVDPTDWKIGDLWTDKEEALFHSLELTSAQAYLKTGTPADTSATTNTIKVTPAYPNPFKTIIAFTVTNNISSGKFEYVIVNTDLTVLKSGVANSFEVGTTSWAFDLSDNSTFAPNNLYRMYYKFVIGNVVFRGHGDIKKVE
jgi:hypothetical protein